MAEQHAQAQPSESTLKMQKKLATTTAKVDRISNLPETLLCHILSFLPTKHAVTTCVLSKRWRTLWTLVPFLDFDDEVHFTHQRDPSKNPEYHTSFVNFAYTVLLLLDAHQPIKRFRLRCAYPSCHSLHVHKWVHTSLQRNVEELELSLPIRQLIKLPPSVFTCSTIVSLKLNGLFLDDIPSSVYLPSLKVLHLEGVLVNFYDSLTKLISGCPVLKDLVLKSLKGAIFMLWMYEDYDLQRSLCSLVKAELGFSVKPDYNEWMFYILRALCNVEFLKLSETITTSLSYASKDSIPVFHNLAHLELMFETYDWDLIAKLLLNSHKLEVLVIHKKVHQHTIAHEPSWMHSQPVPECFLSHLKTVSFKEYQGMQCELKFARYILKNARVLKTMKISSATSKSKRRLRISEKLSAFPWISETCQLLFTDT